MAKTSKKSKETAVAQTEAASDQDTSFGPAITKISGVKSRKTTGKSKAATGKRATRPAGKTPRTRKPRAVTPMGKADRSQQIEISDDDIRLRAYFIAERRLQSGVPGNSTNDWWEAHRQLQEEASTNN